MDGFAVIPGGLNEAGAAIGEVAAKARDLATRIEGGCLAPPNVGDVQATALYQQAHYDWAQTRFEDLMASEAALASMAAKLRDTAGTYADSDQRAAEALAGILDKLDK